MQLTTSVELPKNLPSINHKDHLLLMGSCFAEHIGKKLTDSYFKVDVNPFGILYNPLSVAKAITQLINKKQYNAEELFCHDDCWHSPMHHGCFSHPQPEVTLQNINERLEKGHHNLLQANWLLITFGTAYVYTQKESGDVVSNCHKLPEHIFDRSRLSVSDIVNKYTAIIEQLHIVNPNLKILFTVSPIRHIRDGMHANQLSKATLLLAIDQLCQLYPKICYYFPSYEIMIDELRDYRFYADDFVHPSTLSITYIWRQFSTLFFSVETKKIIEECEIIRKSLQHRPLHPESEEHKSFLNKIALKIEQLKRKYPNLEFSFNIK